MNDDPVPSEILAVLTVDRLIQSGLLRADKRDVLIAQIASGEMKGEDWNLEIDLAQPKTVQE